MPAILPAVFIPFQIGFLALYAPNAPAPVANSGNKLSACWTPVSAARAVVKRGRVAPPANSNFPLPPTRPAVLDNALKNMLSGFFW